MTNAKTSRIPRFQTVAEEAAFWDEHDLTEFEDELEEVDVQFVRPGSRLLNVDLDEETLAELNTAARNQKMRASTLVRRWIVEQLKRTDAAL